MSLVNDMLRDLDARQRGDLSKAASSVPRHSKKSKRKAGVWILALVFLVLAIYIGVRSFAPWVLLESGVHDAWLSPQPVAENAPSIPVENEPETKAQPVASQTEPDVFEKPIALNKINKINWTSTDGSGGHLSLWLSDTRPYTVYENSAHAFEWGVADTALDAPIPTSVSALITRFTHDAKPNEIRFRIETQSPVTFKPSLRSSPLRMVVELAAVSAPVVVLDVSEKTATETAAAPAAPNKPADITPPTAAVASSEVTTVPTPSTGTWRKAMNTLPTDSSTVREARRLLAKQDTSAAIDSLRKFVDQQPGATQSRYLLAQLYLATENYQGADRLMQGAPASLQWALLKGRALLQQGKASDALALLRRFPEGESRQDYLDLLASAYQQSGDHERAVQAYLTVLALDSQQARAWINMGVSLEHLQQRTKAMDAYQNALRIPQAAPELRQYAAQQLQRLK